MPKSKILFLPALALAFTSVSLDAMFDNRFVPFPPRIRIEPNGARSFFALDMFAATASSASDTNERETTIPQLFGRFDQQRYGEAFTVIGLPNPLPSIWIEPDAKIPWFINGKIQAQGLMCSYLQQITRHFFAGFDIAFMRVNAYHEFNLIRRAQESGEQTNLILKEGDEQELDEIRRNMFSTLGIHENHSAQLGFGDMDLFIRLGNTWHYRCKCRYIDLGIRLGLLVPTGVRRDCNKPASIPFGGDGHWGFYTAFDGLFELKEDIKLGIFTRISKRCASTRIGRMPARQEPVIFGTIVGPVRVDPAATFVFSPYFVFENLRKGLGASLQYTMTYHAEDDWKDRRSTEERFLAPSDGLRRVEKLSEWGSDYFTLNVFYDFGKVKMGRECYPIVSFRWDIPGALWMTKQVPRTHRLVFNVEFAF